jgi:CRISPR-associated protein Csb1
VLSLPALRRLRFPVDSQSPEQQMEADVSARTVLAALALAALARQWASGFSLRSRCDLVPRTDFSLQLLAPGETQTFRLTSESGAELLSAAVARAKSAGLPWPTGADSPPWKDGCLTLRPNAELVRAVTRSRELAAENRE